MTEREKDQVMDLLYEHIIAHQVKYDGRSTVLTPVMHKWFRGPDGTGGGSLMAEALHGNTIAAWKLWESIRGLTCKICGVSIVKHIRDEERARRVAEELCATVHRLVMEGKDGKQ